MNKLCSDFPLWVLATMFMLICALGYIGLRTMIGKNIEQRMAAYNDVVKMAPRAANLTITLP
ncbi:hypothetical protein [Pseudoduganella albidiflava]|uniref:Uncharacterized protein n=1 Tax=Pseudoduganella albidiflava TaxID=321983 RepID=A0AA88C4E8_9BURK|nr:hypothetical protein [Pseudoduganella albidiflava]GGY55872.1 hypothetical protein GCM10007387_42850 [Pseudoduganella albidiflava]